MQFTSLSSWNVWTYKWRMNFLFISMTKNMSLMWWTLLNVMCHIIITHLENAINLGCASKHLIKSFKPWPIKRGCTNFLLFGLILILYLAPLVTQLLPTPMHTWKMCIQLLYQILPICFLERLLITLPNFLFANIQKKLELCICQQPALHSLENLDVLEQY